MPPPRDQELRFAVVMSGGVSLAVWMGGVTAELDRLRREQPVYRELLEGLGQQPVVDIVSGTSAGGLNGVLLASSVAVGGNAEMIREVWLRKGDLQELLRPVSDGDPPSLLRGDEYFLPEIGSALGRLHATRDAATKGAATSLARLKLFVTMSLLANRARQYVDSTNEPIYEVEHRGTMAFEQSQLEDTATTTALALAARSSASFPVAFEPSWIPVRGVESPAQDLDRLHPDMSRYAWWSGSGYALDGGLVLNRPLRPALQAIAGQAAAGSVRRLLLLVNPNPNTKNDEEHQKRVVPPLLEVGKAVAAIPRTQSIADDLEELRRHNDQVVRQRGLRSALAALDEDHVQAIADSYFNVYVAQRGALWARDLINAMTASRAMFDQRALDDEGSPLERALAAMHAAREAAALPVLLADDGDGIDEWNLDVSPLERAVRDALWFLRTFLAKYPAAAQRAEIERLRAELFTTLDDLEDYTRAEQEYWTEQLTADGVANRPGAVAGIAARWADAYARDRDGRTPSAALGARAAGIAQTVLDAYEAVQQSISETPTSDTAEPSVDDRLFTSILDLETATVTFTPDTDEGDSGVGFVSERVTQFLRRATRLDVAHAPVLATAVPNDEPLELVHVSANAPNCFDSRALPDEKLSGLQLNHFGSFYRAAWRANDWMWGRLDAAHHLVRALVDRDRLRRVYPSSPDRQQLRTFLVSVATSLPIAAVESALEHPSGPERDAAARAGIADPDAQHLVGDFAKRVAALDLELAALDDPSAPPVVESIARWITERLQLSILREELPRLGKEARDDVADRGAEAREDSRVFEEKAAALETDPPSPVPDVLGAFAACRIGEERIPGERHSQQFAEVSSQSLAVTLNAVSGRSGFTPLRPVLGGARGLTKALYYLTQAAKVRHPVAVVIVSFLSLLAAATVAVSIATGGDLANPVAALALVVVAALAIMALLRDHTGVIVGITSAVVLVGWLSAILWAGSLRGVAQVALALVAALVLLSLIYNAGERTSGRVVLAIVVVWLVAIVAALFVVAESVDWKWVAAPKQCPAGSLVIDNRDDHSTAAKTKADAPHDVLCVHDEDIAAGVIAGITAVILVVAGIWLVVAKVRTGREHDVP